MPDADRILEGLDPEQRAAAQAVRGPVCILAGAGTGKTRAITHRIAYAVATGAVPAPQLLAVTFTARAAGELRGRLRALGAHGVQARTFHAAALRQLQYFAPRILGGALPEVMDNRIRMVGNAAARMRLRTDRTELRDLAAEIDWAKSVLATPDTYVARAREAGRETSTTPETIAKVFAEYEQTKRRAGQLDFADLLLIMAGALEELLRRRRRGPQPVPALRGRRVPGRLAAAAAAAGRVARRPRRPVRRRRRQPDHLLLRRGDTRAPARLPPPLPRGRRSYG